MSARAMTILLNRGSGNEDKAALRQTIVDTLTGAGVDVDVVEIGPGDDFDAVCRKAVARAKAEGRLVVATGGDGTITGVAGHCLREGVTMGILPRGTFNYFARDLGIPVEVEGALDVLLTGQEKGVTIGRVNDHIFLNNASFGLHTTMIRAREQATTRFGRLRFIAALSGIANLFRRHRRFAVLITADGKTESRRTTMLFVGNNTFQLNNLGLDERQVTQRHRLAVVILKRTTPLSMLRTITLSVMRKLKFEENLEQFCADRFEVNTRRKRVSLVIDGEITICPTPLVFSAEREALRVVTPAETPA